MEADDPDELDSDGGGEHEKEGNEGCAEEGISFDRLRYKVTFGAHGEAVGHRNRGEG